MILLRRLSFWLAVAGLTSALVFAFRLSASFGEPVPPPPVEPPVRPPGSNLAAAGIVEALRENTALGVPVSGLVAAILVIPWDQVSAGQPLLRLDDRELRAALLVNEAQVTVADATLQRVSQQLDRLERLAAGDPRAIAADDLSTRRNDRAVAAAQLEAARAAVAQTHALLDRLTVRAPIDATVLQVNVRAGEFISPSATTPPILLGDLSTLQVRADVDEQIAPRVSAGRNATAFLKGDSANAIPLTFVRIEPYVVPKRNLTGSATERVDTRVLQVIFRFSTPTTRPVYVGQQLDVYIDDAPAP